LPDPALPDSSEAKAERDLVLQIQKTRTPEEIARAKSEDKITLDSFTSSVGPWLTAEKLPQLEALIKTMETESKVFHSPGKAYFKRPRPAAVDPRITPVIEEVDFGYPSGHATRGMMYAMVLAELVPESKVKIMARGAEIGWDRVIAGVHYPSDIDAGRTLGRALGRALFATPAFQQKLAQMKILVDAARPNAQAPELIPAGAAH
jgi:acid phosphatase (class A)